MLVFESSKFQIHFFYHAVFVILLFLLKTKKRRLSGTKEKFFNFDILMSKLRYQN